MNIPCARPITDFEKIGDGARVTVTLADIVDGLPIPARLKPELRELSDTYRDASLHILVEASDTVRYQGRGRYFDSRFGEQDITLYSKGVGCMSLLKALAKTDGLSLVGFGPIPEGHFGTRPKGKYFFDYPDHPLHFPRVVGAGYTYDENREFLHAMSVMVNLIRTESYTSVSELLSCGVTIPISTACFPGLTSHMRELAVGELEGTRWSWSDDIELGAVTLVVPSSRRTDTFDRGSPNMTDYSKCIARAMRKLYESSGAIFSPFSTHMQNFYHAPSSVCPSSDNSDLLFDLEPQKRVAMFGHMAADMVFLANADGGYSDNEYKIDEVAFYSELAQEDVPSRVASLSLLKYLALAMEEKLGNVYRPDSKIVEKIMDVKAYNALEERRRDVSWAHVKNSIVDVRPMSPSEIHPPHKPNPSAGDDSDVSKRYLDRPFDGDSLFGDRYYSGP